MGQMQSDGELGEATLSLGGGGTAPAGRGVGSGAPITDDPNKARIFSMVGYSMVGGGALDCVESIGQCPKPECQLPGRKWGKCEPKGCAQFYVAPYRGSF